MNISAMTAAAAIAVAAVGISSGTAHAETATAATGVNYTMENTGERGIIKIDAGSLVNENGTFKIKAANGATLAGVPLSFRVEDYEFPIRSTISGRTATLTPVLDPASARYKPVAIPFVPPNDGEFKTEYEREKDAYSRMLATIARAANLGTLVGLLGGAVVGCVVGGGLGIAGGGVIGAVFGALVGALPAGVAGAVVGCVMGATGVGAVGAIAGAILVTAPVTVAAVIQYLDTINQPLVRPKHK